MSLFRKSSLQFDLWPLPTVLTSVSTAGAGVCCWPLTCKWTLVGLSHHWWSRCSCCCQSVGFLRVRLNLCDHRSCFSSKIVSSSSWTDQLKSPHHWGLLKYEAEYLQFVHYYKHIPLDTDQVQTALHPHLFRNNSEVALTSLWNVSVFVSNRIKQLCLDYKCCWSFYALTNSSPLWWIKVRKRNEWNSF